ncbi:MAG TPA: VOC family protein [Vicinamibacterales bacterium]|nr:VOC family protein [Vicinamibacterales bacterium]
MGEADTAVAGLSHVLLAVRDIDRSLSFYRDVLGLEVAFASGEFVFLRAGSVTLGLRHAPDLPSRRAEDPVGVELVFAVDEIHAAHERLRSRGVGFRVPPRVVAGGQWAADFRDPDGHVLSIFGPARP